MTLPSPSIAAVSIVSLVGAGGGAGIMAVEALGSRRREAPLLTAMRREIKPYKSKFDKYENDMRTEVVGRNTSGIVRSRRNER